MCGNPKVSPFVHILDNYKVLLTPHFFGPKKDEKFLDPYKTFTMYPKAVQTPDVVQDVVTSLSSSTVFNQLN